MAGSSLCRSTVSREKSGMDRLIFGPQRTRRKVSIVDMSPLRHYERSGGRFADGLIVVSSEVVADESWLLQFARGFVRGLFA